MGLMNRLFRRSPSKNQRHATQETKIPSTEVRASPLDIGQASDIGNGRETNEDAFFTLQALAGAAAQPLHLAVLMVADGMGGHVRGEEASSLAIRVASGVILREVLLPMLASKPAQATSRPVHDILDEAITSANEAVSQIEADTGTTLTCALIVGRSAYLAHVGDSRAYYLDRGELHQITQDHSIVNRLVQLGQISADEAHNHPQRNYLYRAVGQGAELQTDTYLQRLAEGSYLILCTDGLWNEVPEQEIVDVVGTSASSHEAANRLVDRANDRGGEDNITVLIAKINY
jgi:serine/threonine protein phosphatase PrpC